GFDSRFLEEEEIRQTTIDAVIGYTFVSFVVLLLNYFLFRLLVVANSPFMLAGILTIAGSLICLPVFFSEKKEFIRYQSRTMVLKDFLDRTTISKVFIVQRCDTSKVTPPLNTFLTDIGNVRYRRSTIWKYKKTTTILIERADSSMDSILTNGQLFCFRGNYFLSDSNVVEKYIKKADAKE
ncbi:MAG: hypothetical protein H7259_07370, partial [Cytophagales bacterium]|nr:hypothetical protein [Cytophaga sp.]